MSISLVIFKETSLNFNIKSLFLLFGIVIVSSFDFTQRDFLFSNDRFIFDLDFIEFFSLLLEELFSRGNLIESLISIITFKLRKNIYL